MWDHFYFEVLMIKNAKRENHPRLFDKDVEYRDGVKTPHFALTPELISIKPTIRS
jgi:hypothetical protein